MNRELEQIERDLIDLMKTTARGPRRNGAFSLWLVVRTCDGSIPPDPVSEKSHRRRVTALERRLTSLSLPPAFRKALAVATRELASGDTQCGARSLALLVAPTRELIGKEHGRVVVRAARLCRAATQLAETAATY